MSIAQTSFFTLDAEIKMTNRRVNALDNVSAGVRHLTEKLQVVIPKIDYGIGYISKELDEMEREEFFRLKKIQEKKKQRAEVERIEGLAKGRHGESAPAGSMLDDHDEDLIF